MSDTAVESSNKKKGLGKGFGALLGENTRTEIPMSKAPSTPAPVAAAATTATAPAGATANPTPTSTVAQPVAPPVDPEGKIWKVAIDKLSPGKYQPRTTFEKEPLQELAQSIKENGILQPIVARRTPSGKLEKPMLDACRKLVVACALALAFVSTPVLAQSDSPSGIEMLLDVVVARPLGFVGMVVGSAAFVVALPFTIPNGDVDVAAEQLVKKPARYTFKRRLGDISGDSY